MAASTASAPMRPWAPAPPRSTARRRSDGTLFGLHRRHVSRPAMAREKVACDAFGNEPHWLELGPDGAALTACRHNRVSTRAERDVVALFVAIHRIREGRSEAGPCQHRSSLRRLGSRSDVTASSSSSTLQSNASTWRGWLASTRRRRPRRNGHCHRSQPSWPPDPSRRATCSATA